MDAKIIYNALKMYKDRGHHDEETKYAIDRLMKDAEDFRRLSFPIVENREDISRVLFVSSGFVIDAMNLMTYDIFGKLAKKHGPDNVPLHDYMLNVHWEVNGCITPSIIEIAADFLKDLWSTNEEVGANREDGTFDK